LADATNIEEKSLNPSEDDVIYTGNKIVPYEHVYPIDNDDHGDYLEIHYISSYVGVIPPNSPPIPSGYDIGPSIPLSLSWDGPPQIYDT